MITFDYYKRRTILHQHWLFFFLQSLILKLEGCVCAFHLWFAAMTTHCEGWNLHILFCSLTFITELNLVTLLKFGGNEICGAMDWEAEVFWFNLQCGQTTGGVLIAEESAKVQSVAQVLLSKVENPKCPHSFRGVPWIMMVYLSNAKKDWIGRLSKIK